MFKFDNYSSIKKMHKKWLKYDRKSTKTLIKVVDKKAFGAESRFSKSIKKQEAFDLLYEKVIFDELVKEKPNIFNRRTEEYVSWDSLIGNDFEQIPESDKVIFILLVEQNGGIYRLPDDYYV